MTALDGRDVAGPEEEPEARTLASIDEAGAMAVLRRGIAASPELQKGLWGTAVMALAVAGSKLLLPLSIQLILDIGLGSDGVRFAWVLAVSVVSAVLAALV